MSSTTAAMEQDAMRHAEETMRAEETERAVRLLTEGMACAQYLPMLGKKKNDRVFWVDPDRAEISWDKRGRREGKRPNKGPEPLRSISSAIPQFRDARSWFEEIDVDGSGELDMAELVELYQMARGETLSGKRLQEAMSQMDQDSSGTIGFAEFESWWKQNTGDLEKKRHLAFSVQTFGTTLLLMAPSASAKRQWILGINEVLRRQAASDPSEDGDEGDDDKPVRMDNRRHFRGVVHKPTRRPPEPEPQPEPEPEPEPQPEPEPEPQPDPEHILHELIFKAATTRAEQRWKEAALLYSEAIDFGIKIDIEANMLSDLYTTKSECHQEANQLEDVLLDLSAAVRLAGNASYPQRRRRAAVLMTLGRFPEAKNELEMALASCPPHFTERAEIQIELTAASEKVFKMPAVLWPGGPSVSVSRFERRQPDGLFDGTYLVYALEVAYISDPAPAVLHKRYSEFQQLFDLLTAEQDCPSLPALPPKTWSGKASDVVGQERTRAFHQFLRKLGAVVRSPESSAVWKEAVRPVLEAFLTPSTMSSEPQAQPQPTPEPPLQPQLSPEEAEVELLIMSGAAVSIQASFRGRKARREQQAEAERAAQKKRVEEIIEQTETERAAQRRLAEEALAEEYEKQCRAATTVQAAARGRNKRREIEKQSEAAKRLQAAARGHAVRIRIRSQQAAADREHVAAVKLQAASRGYIGRQRAMIARILADDEREEAEEIAAAEEAEAQRLMRVEKMAVVRAVDSENAEDIIEEGTGTAVLSESDEEQDVQTLSASEGGAGGGMTMKAMRAQSQSAPSEAEQPREKQRVVSFAPSDSDEEDQDDAVHVKEPLSVTEAVNAGTGQIEIRQPVTYAEELGVSATDAAMREKDAQLAEAEARILRAKQAEADRIAQLEQAHLEAQKLLEKLQNELGAVVPKFSPKTDHSQEEEEEEEEALGPTQPISSPSRAIVSLRDELSQAEEHVHVLETGAQNSRQPPLPGSVPSAETAAPVRLTEAQHIEHMAAHLLTFQEQWSGVIPAGLAAKIQNHLVVEHVSHVLKDQLERFPPAAPPQPTAGQNNMPSRSGAAATSETTRRSRGSRQARQPRQASTTPRSEPTPEGSVWDETDERKLKMDLQEQSLEQLSTRARSMGCDPQWLAMTCKAGDEQASQAKLIHWCTQHAKTARQTSVPSVASVGISDAIVGGVSPAQKAPPERKSRGRGRKQ